MMVRILFLGRTKSVELKNRAKVSDLLEKLDINPETVIVKTGRDVLLETDFLKNKDAVEIIRVTSAG